MGRGYTPTVGALNTGILDPYSSAYAVQVAGLGIAIDAGVESGFGGGYRTG